LPTKIALHAVYFNPPPLRVSIEFWPIEKIMNQIMTNPGQEEGSNRVRDVRRDRQTACPFCACPACMHTLTL
jgi:hypothetical protein